MEPIGRRRSCGGGAVALVRVVLDPSQYVPRKSLTIHTRGTQAKCNGREVWVVSKLEDRKVRENSWNRPAPQLREIKVGNAQNFLMVEVEVAEEEEEQVRASPDWWGPGVCTE